MKKFKKIAALLLAMVMALAMAVPAMADTGSATITINNAGSAAKFGIAQIVEPDTSKETGWKICAAYVDEFAKAFYGTEVTTLTEEQEQTIIKAMIEEASDDTGEDDEAPKKGSDLLDGFDEKYAAALAAVYNSITDDACTETSPITVTKAGVYVVKGVEEGYTYSPMAAYISFGYTNGVPTSLTSTSLSAKKTDNVPDKTTTDPDKVVAVGAEITYQVITTVPYNKTSWNLVDKIKGASYKLNDSSTVTVNVYVKDGTGNWTALTDDSGNVITFEGTVTNPYTETNDDGETTFSGEKMVANVTTLLTTLTSGTDVKFEYVATCEETYVENRAWNNYNDGDSDSDNEEVYTGKITLTKYGEDDTTTLGGATFNVYEGESTTALTFTKNTAGEYVYDPDSTNTDVVTGDNGTLVVKGLDVGTYKFVETVAPEGYSINEAGATATLEVTSGTTEATAELTATASLYDTKLSALPSTGGMGTYLFTIGGVVIMIAAAGMLVMSRKKNA